MLALFAEIAHANSPIQTVVQLGAAQQLSFAAISPDGRYAACAGWDNSVRLWDLRAGEQVRGFGGHTDNVVTAEFSSDGSELLTASWDGTARLWRVADGSQVQRFDCNRHIIVPATIGVDGRMKLSGFKTISTWVTSATFSPDSTEVLTSSTDGTNRIWSIATGREITRFEIHTRVKDPLYDPVIRPPQEARRLAIEHWNQATWAVFLPRFHRVLTTTWGGEGIVWNPETKKETHHFRVSTSIIQSASASPDGHHVLITTRDATVSAWDISGKQQTDFVGHQDRVNFGSYSTSGKYVVTASDDHTARLWNALTGHEIIRFTGHKDVVNSAVITQDERWVLTASGDRTIRLWDAYTGTEVNRFRGVGMRGTWAALSPDNIHLVTLSEDNVPRVWNLETGSSPTLLIGHVKKVTCAAFSPNGQAVATTSLDGTVRIWDTITGHEIRRFTDLASGLSFVVFTPDGRSILTTPETGTVAQLWNIDSNTMGSSFEGNGSAAISPDGHRIAIADGSIVRIWTAGNASPPVILSDHNALISSITLSRDGKLVAAGGDDGIVRIWDAQSGDEKQQIINGTAINVITFSPNSHSILTGGSDNVVHEWDVGTGTWRRDLSHHEYGVRALSYSQDGQRMLALGGDGVARLWSVTPDKDATEIATLMAVGQSDYVITIPAGYYLASLNGCKGMAFLLGNSVYPFEQFDLTFNRPDLVLEALGSQNTSLITAYRRAYDKRLAVTYGHPMGAFDPDKLPHVKLSE